MWVTCVLYVSVLTVTMSNFMSVAMAATTCLVEGELLSFCEWGRWNVQCKGCCGHMTEARAFRYRGTCCGAIIPDCKGFCNVTSLTQMVPEQCSTSCRNYTCLTSAPITATYSQLTSTSKVLSTVSTEVTSSSGGLLTSRTTSAVYPITSPSKTTVSESSTVLINASTNARGVSATEYPMTSPTTFPESTKFLINESTYLQNFSAFTSQRTSSEYPTTSPRKYSMSSTLTMSWLTTSQNVSAFTSRMTSAGHPMTSHRQSSASSINLSTSSQNVSVFTPRLTPSDYPIASPSTSMILNSSTFLINGSQNSHNGSVFTSRMTSPENPTTSPSTRRILKPTAVLINGSTNPPNVSATTSTTAHKNGTNQTAGKISVGAIAGGALGALAVVGLLVSLLVFKKKRAKVKVDNDGATVKVDTE